MTIAVRKNIKKSSGLPPITKQSYYRCNIYTIDTSGSHAGVNCRAWFGYTGSERLLSNQNIYHNSSSWAYNSGVISFQCYYSSPYWYLYCSKPYKKGSPDSETVYPAGTIRLWDYGQWSSIDIYALF